MFGGKSSGNSRLALNDHSMGIKKIKKVIKGERPLPFQAQKPFVLLLIDFNLYFFHALC